MTKLPRSDPRAQHIATDTTVERRELDAFVRVRHKWVMATTRRDGRPQLSPITGGLLPSGALVTSTYPERAKVANVRRNPLVSVLVMGEEFNSEWVQVDGDARVAEPDEAVELLVEYYRSISGEHPDWDEYRQAMVEQEKTAILIEPTRWGPISKGGFPASLFEPTEG